MASGALGVLHHFFFPSRPAAATTATAPEHLPRDKKCSERDRRAECRDVEEAQLEPVEVRAVLGPQERRPAVPHHVLRVVDRVLQRVDLRSSVSWRKRKLRQEPEKMSQKLKNRFEKPDVQ